MGNMKPHQIQARMTWVLGNKTFKRKATSNHAMLMHQRGYHKGDIRCTRCDKWLNPNDPEEAKEIKWTPGHKRIHISKYCKYFGNGFGCAVFSTVPRTSPNRKRHVDEAHRY